MRGLQRINSELQIDQLITIWVKVQTTSLTEDEDKISWALTANSTYSMRSAYEVQFYGLSESPLLHRVWEIKAEGKINFFLWLILQNMVSTADHLATRGWPHNDLCSLCDQEVESIKHLLLECPFAKEVWFSFHSSHPHASAIAWRCTSLNGWWRKISRNFKKKEARMKIAMSVYTV